MTRHGVEVFPSLVEAARAVREPEWRAKDEELEMAGLSLARNPRRLMASIRRPRIIAALLAGETYLSIKQEVGVSEQVVYREFKKFTPAQKQQRAEAAERRRAG